jgi:D-alanyl-D-alanine carboxypeptidase (penicillin-binding protein 5/6)
MTARAVRRATLVLGALTALIAALPAAGQAAGRPALSVRAAALSSARTGQLLYGVNPHRRMAIASTTKLMTALLTLEHTRHLGTMFTEPSYYPAPADSQIGLVPGERMSVHDLLIALLLPSADDAAEDLAYNVGRHSVARFIGMMNARARELRLRHTHYSTPIGLDTPGNYSTASDLLKLARYVLRTQAFFGRVVDMPSATLRTGNHRRYVVNRNDLVGRVRWIDGVKTGHTLDAGYVLVGSGTRHGLRLLSVVLGTSSESSRDSNTLALLDYGFASFRLMTPVRRGQVLARPTVRDQPGKRADVIAARSFTSVFARVPGPNLRVEVPHQLAGPLPWHAVVGRVLVMEHHRPVADIPLLLAHKLPAVSAFTLAARFITRPFTLVPLVVLLGSAIALAARRRWRGRGTRDRGAQTA